MGLKEEGGRGRVETRALLVNAGHRFTRPEDQMQCELCQLLIRPLGTNAR